LGGGVGVGGQGGSGGGKTYALLENKKKKETHLTGNTSDPQEERQNGPLSQKREFDERRESINSRGPGNWGAHRLANKKQNRGKKTSCPPKKEEKTNEKSLVRLPQTRCPGKKFFPGKERCLLKKGKKKKKKKKKTKKRIRLPYKKHPSWT